MACVDLPAFPLQLLLRRHPDWRSQPVAVVDSDKPQGVLLWVNERARASRILPGMRYAAALALTRDLRAAEVPPQEIDEAVAALNRRLCYFTPYVEPAAREPGVFWLDASGLERLHDSLGRWAGLIRSDLERSDHEATVVVGFSRFGTYALARAKRGVIVFGDPGEERAMTRRVPLDRLSVDPSARDTLDKLGVKTVGDFVDLPPSGIEARFGADAYRLHRLATGELQIPLQPEIPEAPAVVRMGFDHPETDVPRLMLVIERLLGPLVEMLSVRRQALTEVLVGFRFESTGDHIESIRPAAPTLDAALLLDLIRLRLSALRKLPDGAIEIVLFGKGAEATGKQLELLAERPRRDPAAANRALARVRAELGEAAVVRARLREGHLPEGSFTWERLDELKPARPRELATGGLVRRLHTRPLPLAPRSRHEPDGWLPRGLTDGPVVRMAGPYVVSGGWWRREVHREYHFAETQKGELLWVYWDRDRRKWFMQGKVE